jgi:two-component system sensor histidine kinase CiaH
MFKKARLKLTAWYLAIIMFISLSFSAFIYSSVTLEIQNRFSIIERRLELRPDGFGPPSGQVEYFIEDLEASRNRILLVLLYTNITILFFSAVAGYFLAGKTLTPIEKSMEEQRRFVADASHEFRTPLTSLQTSIEVALRDKKMDLNDAKDVLKGSLGDIENLTSLSNYLLGLARFQNNSLSKASLNIKDVVKKVEKQIAPIAKSKNIFLKVESDNIKIVGNEESLEKLVTIFLDNAVKYTSQGGKVTLLTKKDRRYLLINVKDTGIGISKKDLPHIFERFYRADLSRSKEEITGFGLGLAMAKEIVDLHKGTIDVESQPGKGSTFIIKLPL